MQLLCGADFPITTAESDSKWTRILLGGPDSNELTAQAQQQGLVDFSNLKQDGFLLHSVKLNGQSVLVVGGNDEASTMYAAYDLLERLGIVFQITGDVNPQRKPDLNFPALHVRMEPALKYRGLHMRHLVMPWMDLDYFGKFFDQLAKMKCNYLEFYWYVGAPWIEYSYRGEKKLIGDVYTKESGFLTWRINTATFTASDVRIGREHFPEERVCATEFQHVDTPEEAYRTARQFLKQVIELAHRRKIQIWLGMGDCPGVPPNLGRHSRTGEPHSWAGIAIPPGNPAGLEVWKAAIRSMIETYPEADGYWLWLAEVYFHSNDPETKEIISQYHEHYHLIPSLNQIQELGYDLPSYLRVLPKEHEIKESNIALIHYGKEIAESIRSHYPSVGFGIAVLGRAYLFRAMHALIPQGVAFCSMESSGVWNLHSRVPMKLFSGMGGREVFLVPRLDDDESEFGPQFNVQLYYHDQVLRGSLENGVVGIAPQTGKLRGLEHNAKFIAQGTWDVTLTPEEFYRQYTERMFGERAVEPITEAFLTLEKNEADLGWRGFANFLNYADMPEVTLMGLFRYHSDLLRGPDAGIQNAAPHFHVAGLLDREKDEPFWIQAIMYKHSLFGRSIELLKRSLVYFYQAEKQILPGSRQEWEYLVGKTAQFILHLETIRSILAAFISYHKSFRAGAQDQKRQMLDQLGQCEFLFSQAREQARETARQLAASKFIKDPTEKYILFRYNVRFLLPIEEFCKFIKNVVNFHHGQPYWEKVDWDVIAPRQWMNP